MDKITARTGIYHEHQIGALCAQHALNNLLQNPMFSADTLADIARALDAEEKTVIANTSSQSENMDDTGFFSIQVLQRALKTFEIELVPFASQEHVAKQARSMPESIQAYICNLGLHWFTIRRFGRQHFDLNSMYFAPRLLRYPELEMYLNVIRQNGYSVFIVNGPLPDSLADQQLLANPIGEAEYNLLVKDLPDFIMDGKTMTGSKDPNKRRQLAVHLPKDLYDEFQKNPDNPHIRELISAQLPKGMKITGISDDSGCSNPQHKHHRGQLIISTMEEDLNDEEPKKDCPCGRHHSQSREPPRQYMEQVIEETNIDNSNERHREPQMVARHITQVLIAQPNPNGPNASAQPQIIAARQITIIDQPSNRNNLPMDSRSIQQAAIADIDDDEEDFFLNEAINRSLSNKTGTDEKPEISIIQKRLEMLYEKEMRLAIADSLLTNILHTQQIEQMPELSPTKNKDTSSTQPEVIKIPSSPSPIDTHSSPPVVNVDKSPSTDTNSSPSINVHTPSLTNTSLSSSTNTHSESQPNTPSLPPPSPTATNSPPPTVADSHIVVSPTIEELRQRLQFNGKKHRSIISVQSNFDD